MSLFVQNNNKKSNHAGQLANTARLTEQAATLARKFVSLVTSEEFATSNAELIKESQSDNVSLNELLEANGYVNFENIEWLKEVSDDELDKMFKSQQSKRSRAKKADMTIENYIKMVTAAICENMIREATGKGKLEANSYKLESLVLTDEQIEEFKNDQELLRKAIRNIQSRKSIMKKKEGFDANSEEWLALVDFEEQLKALRTTAPRTTTKVAEETKKAAEAAKTAKELLESIEDVNKLKAADAKALLAKLEETLATE